MQKFGPNGPTFMETVFQNDLSKRSGQDDVNWELVDPIIPSQYSQEDSAFYADQFLHRCVFRQ